MTDGNGTPPTEAPPPQLNVLVQYTKDLSFETCLQARVDNGGAVQVGAAQSCRDARCRTWSAASRRTICKTSRVRSR